MWQYSGRCFAADRETLIIGCRLNKGLELSSGEGNEQGLMLPG
jgi:hypothetical protein